MNISVNAVRMNLSSLPWDSNFFGMDIAQLAVPDGPLPAGALAASGHAMVQCCVPEHHPACAWLEDAGFRFVDTRIVLRGPVTPRAAAGSVSIRRAVVEDLPALAFCDGIFTDDSRFHFDGLFPRALIDRFYQCWIRNSIGGTHDDACFLAERDGRACGLVTVRQLDASTLRMGLMGIDANAQGMGVGSALTAYCMDYAAQHGCSILEAITEGRNLRTQQFHQKNGLAVEEIYRWYYWVRSRS